MSDDAAGLLNRIRNSQLLRILLIGFLILLLQIPILMIFGLIRQRTQTRDEAIEDITGKWGREQIVMGPVISVPYLERWIEELDSGKQKHQTAQRHAYFLPESLVIQGEIESETRSRGIFSVPVYRMSLGVEGRFLKPDFSGWAVDSGDILWDRAELWIRISDARAIQNQASLKSNDTTLEFAPGTGEFGGGNSGIHVPLRSGAQEASTFSYSLVLNGSLGVFFAPMGRETKVSLRSDWSHPSFQGNWLPTERKVGDEGFESRWSIPSLGRNYPQRWNSGSDFEKELEKSRFGVEFRSPVDPYRMSDRSVKYEALFLLLTFLSLWLFEVLSHRRIHSLQYLLVGAAMCIFYLLLLSLSEHLGFLAAYWLASIAVVGLITAYCAAILKRPGWTITVGGLNAGLYGYLYVLLKNEDYALLIGSIGLFCILAVVMYLTRKTDWQRAGVEMSARQGGSGGS